MAINNYFCTMFLKRLNIILSFTILAAIILSCRGYEQILKSRDYKLKLSTALDYYNTGEYVKASTLFDQIAPIYKGTIKADTVFYYQAMSYYMQRDYILSGHYFNTLASDYPKSVFAEEADFMTGYCYYKLSPKPSLDQENTVSAITSFQLFMIQYPSSPRIKDAQTYIIEMRDKLVEKSYLNAKLYFNMGDYKASIIALKNSLNEFPDTKYREELLFLILKSSYLLADNSVYSKRKERFQDAVDEYYTFISEFPESKYKKEAQKMYETSMNLAGTKDQL
jgi:outer membrane protein assembly factor BamD